MNFLTLKVLYKVFLDAVQRRDARTSWVISGLAPSATGAGSLGVSVAAGTCVVNGVYVSYAGGSAGTAAANTSGNPRVDAIRIASGASTPSLVTGTAAAQPVMPAIGANDLLIGAAFVPDGATDFTAAGAYVEDLTSWRGDITTTQGDIIKGDANGVAQRLARGSALQVLRVNAGGTDIEYGPGAAGGTPAVVLGSGAAAGVATTFLRDDDTIAAFDATLPTAQAYGDAAATGSVARAARRDHVHGFPNEAMPNLIPNSDFSRRTKWMTFMPETFADLLGWTVVDGVLGTVAANVLTAGTNGTWSAKAGLTTWRDVRFSSLVKQLGTGTTNTGRIGVGKTDGTAWLTGNGVYATYYRTALNTVTLELIKVIAGVVTVVASQAGVTWADGRVGWAEIEAQGMTYIARFYDQGSGVPGAKSAATRLDNGSIVGTVADAAVVSGICQIVNGPGVGVATVWGGLATGDGGVYVEGWGPESWTEDTSQRGVAGGQAFGFDESIDAGPLGKQWTLRTYIPATTRSIFLYNDSPGNSGSVSNLLPSVAYTASAYWQVSGKGGSGYLASFLYQQFNTSNGSAADFPRFGDAGEVTYTRGRVTATTFTAARRTRAWIEINVARTATGTAFVDLLQLEQGSAATAWRNAPEDNAPLIWELQLIRIVTTTSATLAELESRDLAINAFVPWDATLLLHTSGIFENSAAAGTENRISNTIDAAALPNKGADIKNQTAAANIRETFAGSARATVAAGKHRIAVVGSTNAGTMSLAGTDVPTRLQVVATKGR